MTDDEIIAIAKSLGWNVEHAQTNRMLVLFAREIFSKERALFDAALLNSRPGKLKREHITDGSPCWCNPELDYKDPDTGAAVWVHKEPQ